jgi:hypothetical protein
MFRKIRQTILQLREAAGIEISLLPEEQVLIRGVSLNIGKGEVVKRSEFQSLSSYEGLVKKLSTKIPLAVVIHGKGVLQKKIPGAPARENVFEETLPNANPNEFFVEIAEFGHFSWLSIIRKDLLEKTLCQLQALGFRLLSVSIGPGSIESIVPFINFEKERIVRNDPFEVTISEQNKIADIAQAQAGKQGGHPADPKAEYNIGNQYVLASSVLAFAAATGLLSAGLAGHTGIETDIVSKERDEYAYFRYFVAGRWALMITVFFVLLVNFFVYSYYFNRNSELKTSLAVNSQQSSSYERIRTGIGSRQAFFESNGWNRSSRLSFYADRIAGLVPSGTVLTSIRINPLNNGVFPDGTGVVFKRDIIQIAGTCDDPTELNRWMNNLRNIDPIRKVSLLDYSYKREMATGTFTMEIITK